MQLFLIYIFFFFKKVFIAIHKFLFYIKYFNEIKKIIFNIIIIK